MKYQSIQFAPDGDYVTDYQSDSVAGIWDIVNDQGSRWYFYPIPFVITNGGNVKRKRILSCPDGFGHFHGRTVATVNHHLASLTDNEREGLLI